MRNLLHMFVLTIQEPQRRTSHQINLVAREIPKVGLHIRNYSLAFRAANRRADAQSGF
jgi:hypothetical protein